MQHEKIIRLLLSYILIIYQPATRCLDKTRLFESVPLALRICRLPRTVIVLLGRGAEMCILEFVCFKKTDSGSEKKKDQKRNLFDDSTPV